MEELGWVFVGEIYKHLISLEGKYSTNPDRHITLLVKDIVEDALNAGELDNSISSADLTLIIMRISRGAIFDWCLFQGSYQISNLKIQINKVANKAAFFIYFTKFSNFFPIIF